MEEGDYRGRHKKVWRLCGPAVMYAAAQNAVEDLASVSIVFFGRGESGGGRLFLCVFTCSCAFTLSKCGVVVGPA